MDPGQRTAFIRLVIICAAWALGEALVWQLRASGLGIVVPVLLAAAAYVATRDLFAAGGGGAGGGGAGGGDSTYWRGRPIDRDRWRH